MMHPKLSILIPVYNPPGNWFRNILDTLCKQKTDYPDTEIVVVDDGSKPELSWVSDYPVMYFWKENGGEASARNACLDNMRGDYFHFIDHDDEIYRNCLEVIHSNIEEGYDFVAYNFVCDGDIKRAYHNYGKLNYNCAMWGYTFRTAFTNGARFDESIVAGCDTDYLARVLRDDCKHKIDDRVFYNYRWNGNENSMCHRKLRGEIS